MANRHIERFIKSHPMTDFRKEALRRHPAFLLAKEELTNQTSVIDILRRVRKEKRFSQKRLAELTGLSQSYIAHLESGFEKNPGLQSIEKIASALGRKIVII